MRGTIIREEIKAARSLGGNDAIDAALDQLEPEVSAELRDVLAVSWCRLSSLRHFHESAAAVLKEDPTSWHLRVVEHATHEMFHSTWRFFLRFTSPEAVVKRASSMYARIFDAGHMEASIIAPGHSVARLTGWPEPPAFHLDGVATGMVTVLKIAKVEAVRIRWTRTPDGAEFEVRSAAR